MNHFTVKNPKQLPQDECPYGDKYYVEVSGSKIRKAIKEKTEISEIFIRKEILNALQNMKNAFVN